MNVATGVPRGTSIADVHRGTSVTMIQRTWIVAIGMAMLFAASNMWNAHDVAREIAVTPHQIVETTTVIDNSATALPGRDDEWAEPRIDLNGNEIDAAVGDYRLDNRGEMYERHAPDTALLHLSAAGS